MLSVALVETIKYLDLPAKILHIFNINSTEYLETTITWLISLTLTWLSGKIFLGRFITKMAHAIIDAAPSVTRMPLYNQDVLKNPYPMLLSECNINAGEDAEYNSKHLIEKDRKYCLKLQKAICKILHEEYKFDWYYSFTVSHALANGYLRRRHLQLVAKRKKK